VVICAKMAEPIEMPDAIWVVGLDLTKESCVR